MVHTRDAEDDTLDAIRQAAALRRDWRAPLLHRQRQTRARGGGRGMVRLVQRDRDIHEMDGRRRRAGDPGRTGSWSRPTRHISPRCRCAAGATSRNSSRTRSGRIAAARRSAPRAYRVDRHEQRAAPLRAGERRGWQGTDAEALPPSTIRTATWRPYPRTLRSPSRPSPGRSSMWPPIWGSGPTTRSLREVQGQGPARPREPRAAGPLGARDGHQPDGGRRRARPRRRWD